MNNRETAKKLLVHYFRQVYEKAGLEWNYELTSEVEGIVDAIVDAAVNEVPKPQKYVLNIIIV